MSLKRYSSITTSQIYLTGVSGFVVQKSQSGNNLKSEEIKIDVIGKLDSFGRKICGKSRELFFIKFCLSIFCLNHEKVCVVAPFYSMFSAHHLSTFTLNICPMYFNTFGNFLYFQCFSRIFNF